MNMEEFEARLKRYMHDIEGANTESTKAFLFMEFIRDVFKHVVINSARLDPDLEKYIKSDKTILVKGRIDALLGNVIIEFENNLKRRKLDEAKSQLQRYTAILWNNIGMIKYLCIASDGFKFYIFRPRSSKIENFTERDIILEEIDNFDIREIESTKVYKNLDRYFLYHTLKQPTAINIVEDFGLNSIIFKDCINELKNLWDANKSKFTTIYNEWSKYLSIVYGNRIDNEELFLKHTYLATLAKLMVYTYYEGNVIPTSKNVINNILRGGIFKQYGIENFLIEDFFSWLVKADEEVNIADYILEGLERYDLSGLNEDVFKELYQQLVDPEERHDLGEYYTPDWLADRIVRNVVKVNSKVLDPSCGSGTFLASTIRFKLDLLKDLKPSERLKSIINSVYGIDVHPLAVLISKANYLMALGEDLSKKEENIYIPIYLADSIVFPSTYFDRYVYTYNIDQQRALRLPSLPSNIENKMIDELIDVIRDHAINLVEKRTNLSIGFEKFVKSKFRLDDEQFAIVENTAKVLAELITMKKDTIHSFILKNIYKPSMIGRFDVIVGNPPWLSYRYIQNTDRQNMIKDMIIREYNLLDSKDDELLTHMELASLFLIRCADKYLNNDGIIAFVMPRSLFTGDQHDNFRRFSFRLDLAIKEIWDLDKLSPLFNVPSCVIIAEKSKKNEYPLNAFIIEGKLKHKNAKLDEFNEYINKGRISIKETKLKLIHRGERSAWVSEDFVFENNKSSVTQYKKKFKQGATIVPRSFWFVDIKKHERFGINARMPYLETSQRAKNMAKDGYKEVVIKGNIESEYLYATLLGSDVLPFIHLPFRLVVLPIKPSNNSYKLLTRDIISRIGHEGMATWLEECEKLWNEIRMEKADRSNIYEWLNYSNKITNQDPSKRYVVLYNTSGTFLSSCIVDLTKELSIQVDGIKLKLQGFVAESKCYYYSSNLKDEIYYLSSILNSSITDNLIKPFQTRGLWGPRDIHKKVLELPIEEFNPDNSYHKELAELGKKARKKAENKLPTLLNNIDPATISPNQVGRLRSKIREELTDEISEIDEIVTYMLTREL
ncbi:MAG: BseRI endonuclease [Candidatus Nitrosocaldaceae archaeon]|nr:MAG: BseRI endonuclease [Candidatus Nitrosocaldaceae archaeon]